MNYPAALDFILGRTDYERWPGYTYASRFDLRRMHDLLGRLGDPHLEERTVHIAGSKGKGSTAAMIAAGLQAAGYRTGLYTSPHLITLRERIKVDGKQILKSELARVTERMRTHVEEMDKTQVYGELSTFELLTTAGFLHFADKKVGFTVLETGLGGRLDATNVAQPEICVLTSIGLDHTQVLGDTIAKVAAEKAGIIKEGVPVVTSPQDDQAYDVIQQACLQKGAGLISVGRDIGYTKVNASPGGQVLQVEGQKGSYRVSIPLLGAYQAQNAATAVAALEALGVSSEHIETGLARTYWPGRLQVVRKRPLLVLDGAHSPDSARKLAESLVQYFDFSKLILIIGTSADKDTSGIVAALGPLAGRVYVTRARHPRSTAAEVLAGQFARAGIKAVVEESVSRAIDRALQEAGKKDLICATGSLFLVGEALEHLWGRSPEVYPPSRNQQPLPLEEDTG